MDKRVWLILSLLLGSLSWGFSQPGIHLGVPDYQFSSNFTSSTPTNSTVSSSSGLSPNLTMIHPQFVKDNPRGYSYLCRLELQIEDKLPIGVWINLGEHTNLAGNSGGNAHVKFKLLNF